MATYPTIHDTEATLLKKIATNTADIAGGGSGGGIGAVDSVNGETGDVVLDKTDIGLGNVDNTSDALKPISTAAQAEFNIVLDQIAALVRTDPPPSGNILISGGGVSLISNLSVAVSAAEYTIQGTTYTSPQATLTAGTADVSFPRIDVVALNTSGVAVIIPGTATATPVKPDVDPTTQLELTFFLVAAGATALTTNVVNIYHENTEYTTTQSGGHITLASTNNPNLGTKDIEGTAVVAGDYFQFQTPSGTIDLGNNDNLIFWIRSKASWANAKQLTISARLAGTQVGSLVTFKEGTFGFLSSNTSTYQQIVIPLALFNAAGLSVDQFRFTCAGGGAAIGFYIDDVTLQGGLGQSTNPSRMRWRGTYVSTNFYNVNDVVLSVGVQYVCIQAGSAHTPASSASYWQASSGNALTNVTNDVQTKAAVVPNTAPSAGQILVGNVGGTAYAPVSASGDVTISSTGAHTLGTVNSNVGSFTSANITVDGKGRVTAAANGSGASGAITASAYTMATSNLLGRTTASTGAIEEISVGAGLTLSGGTLTASSVTTIPQNSKSADYTFVLGDAGYHIYHPSADTSARSWTVPANGSVAYPIGTTITLVNDAGAGTLSILITTDTLRLMGSGATGTRTLLASGIATLLKVTSTLWVINGTNLS